MLAAQLAQPLAVEDGNPWPCGRVELVNVSVSGEPEVRVGQVVMPAGLVGLVWEQTRNGEARWGVAYRADTITPAAAAKAA